MNPYSSTTGSITRRHFLKNSAKAAAVVSLIPAALPIPANGQATCAKPYGSGLYGAGCYPGKKLLRVPSPQSNIRIEGFKAYLEGEPGRVYEIQGSQDLVSWQRVRFATMPADGSSLLITDSIVTSLTHRFYRALPQ